MTTGMDALERLRAGNRRYVSGLHSVSEAASHTRRRKLVAGQQPFAVILGCSDSRVPVEILFDQGLGDLFVVRVAGNVATPVLVGSVEYAVDSLGVRLVVVLGHSNCGAVGATLEYIDNPLAISSPNLREIADRIRSAVKPVLQTTQATDRDAVMENAVRANVHASAAALTEHSDLLAKMVQSDGLHVVGASYSLETGCVDFFDYVPENAS